MFPLADVAWMLRQDGKAFPCRVHLYCMGDDTLDSEAECAAFLIASGSKDVELAEEVIDTWLAFMIENEVSFDADEADVDDAIIYKLSSLPYKFAYPLSNSKILNIHHKCNNYDDMDSLYDFCDRQNDRLSDIQQSIKDSINQQFSRVRYGGRLNSLGEYAGPSGSIWCRVSSLGYNWANTFYIFIANNYRKMKISSVYICRDYESDNGDDYTQPDYFYKAKDGQPYYDMPISEYLQEEHEHSPVFSAQKFNVCRGVVDFVKHSLLAGKTIHETNIELHKNNVTYDMRRMLSYDRHRCIESSKFLEEIGTRTKMKLSKICQLIKNKYSYMTSVSVIDVLDRANSQGNPVGFEMIFKIRSDEHDIDGLEVSVVSKKALSQVPAETVARLFSIEYGDYLKFSGKGVSL